MPRLANRGTTERAPQTTGAFSPLPNFSPQLSEVDGGQTNAAFQRWNSQMRARLEGNSQQDNGRFKDIQTTIDRHDGYLESVWTMEAIAGPVVTGMTLFSSIDPEHNTTVSRITFQADVFQIQTATGNHKEVFSTSADAIKLGDVLTVDLVNAKVFIGTGTYNNNNTAFFVDDDGFFSLKSFLSFNPNTNTLSIATTAGSAGGWTINPTTLTGGNATLDSSGALILGTSNDIVYVSAADTTYRLWVGNVTAASATFSVTKGGALFSTSGTIGGWTIGTANLTANNVVINSVGTIALGTSNDILIMSAADSTYRIWAGNATAGSASFSVTKAGALFSSSGTIGGFTIGPSTLSNAHIYIDSSGTITVGPTSGGQESTIVDDEIHISNSTGATVRVRLGNVADNGIIELFNSSAADVITLDASTGAVAATSFAGSGASLTSLNASSISSGTLDNARLPSAISVSSLTASGQIRGATARFGTFSAIGAEVLTGYITHTDDGGTTRKLGVIA